MVYIFVRYHHWLVLSLMMKSFFEKKGKKTSIVVMNQSSIKYFEMIGLIFGKNVLGIKSFNEKVHCTENDEVVFHHSKGFIQQLLENVNIDSFQKAGVSFYADGYTNRFLDCSFVSSFIDDKVLRCSNIYFFDKMESIPISLKMFNVNELDSSILLDVFSNKYLEKVFDEAYNKISLSAGKKVIVMLRPWGSDNFQKGKFKSDKNILMDFLDFIDAGGSSSFVIRPDYRDNTYMHIVEDRIRDKFPEAIIINDDIWPEWLTFDAFLYFFSNREAIKPILFSSDSTAASPFLKFKLFSEINVGAPSFLIDKYFPSDDSIFNKIKMLKRIYSEYGDSVGFIDYSEDCFFNFKLNNF